MTPTIDNNGYISSPYNTKTNPTYNTITIESINKQELQFTTPNILTSFNKVIEIFDTYFNNRNSWEDIRAKLREDVRHPKVREWAIYVLGNAQGNNNNTAVASTNVTNLKSNMSNFLKNSSGIVQDIEFTFNSETGSATGKFKYRLVSNQTNVISTPVEEDVGDMLRSNYIILRDRNVPTADGYVKEWEVNEKQCSHRIYHNLPNEVRNISILYKNMYL